ncbi:hypothetical protein LMG27174_03257 [Paraburkholderia rhynchosiae]|uniref:Alpha/beta hydrolase n=1 Tax=Paraburkholderia rhynchosiae TaxID=487049 RepID=A0A6J5B5R6_9BURK|nr:hypothetical protein LMG27174_03257 [Paraburkholderia rhynchosiae]
MTQMSIRFCFDACFHRTLRRTAAALQSWLPDARRETVRGASHGMNLARPSAFNRYIDEFIRAMNAG